MFLSRLRYLFILFFPLSLMSQQIQSLTIIPEDPITTQDVVSVIAMAWHPNSGCPIVNTQIVMSQDTIYVDVIHEQGLATAICNSIDTTALGTFDPGTYTVTYQMTSGVFGDIQVSDTSYTEFTVQGVNSTDEVNGRKDELIYPNPANDFIILGSVWKGNISVFDAQGKLIMQEQIIQAPFRLEIQSFEKGIYLLVDSQGRSEKLIVN